MDPKHLAPLLAAALLTGMAGCATLQPKAGWPEPRPLSDDLPTYRPPVEPEGPNTSSPFASAETDSLTLGMALARALLQNPELQAFAYAVRAREAERVQAGRWPNPTLSAEAEQVSTASPIGDFSASEQLAQVGQRIPLGGDVDLREDVAAAERDLAGWAYEAKRLDVITEVKQAFAGVLAAQERLAQTRELLNLAEALYQAVAEQVEAGEVSPVELERVTVERAQARIDVAQAEEALRAARQRLAAALGVPELPFENVRGDLEAVCPVPPLEALTALLSRNPRLARYADVLRKRRAQIDLEQAELIPDPSISGGMQRFGATGERAFTVGLSIPIPLFDRNQGAIEAAQYRLDQARRARREAAVELRADLEAAYRNLTAAYAEVVALHEEVLPAAEAAFETFREGYRLGEFDLLRVIDAQRTLFDARLQYVEALEAYRQARAEVERLVATPFDTLSNENE